MDEIVQFDFPTDSPKIIKVIGVGGGGGNAVNHMYREGIHDVTFVLCNTDNQALAESPVPVKLQLGRSITQGLGAGNRPERARDAAEESIDDIKEQLNDGTKMVFITAGMGGGTGTGAAPVIARIAKEMDILTVGIVTIPFIFEGEKKIIQALDGVERIAQHVDALLVINNERLREIYADLTFMNAFGKADDTLSIAAKSIAEIITMRGTVNLDFADVKTILKDGGVAIMSTGFGEGENPVEADRYILFWGKGCNWSNRASIARELLGLDKAIKVVDKPNPTELMKAVKNKTEVDNTRAAHVKDGVAFTKFMYWLKTNIGKIPMTEISASDYLEARRREQDNFIELSFNTICAYGANAAMMHYAATPESDAELKPEGFLLVDSGGHYFEGTTDITRTMALGPITDEMRLHFTTVCRSNMNLAHAKFLYGCTGLNLDILSRGPLWEMGIDYKCGTGHGVGYVLNVHEGPNGFRWRVVPERHDNGVLEEGMITTDEPGVYLEGKYGIRTENELVCHKAEKNEYGQFMEFENITYAPIDLDAIAPDLLSAREKKMLNDYHKMVYDTISPYMTAEENEWLKRYTRAI